MDLRAHFRQRPLYLITDGAKLRREGKLISAIQSALDGGGGKIGAVQLREQIAELSPASPEEVFTLCGQLSELCARAGALLILNVRARSLGTPEVNHRVPIGSLLKLIGGFHLGAGSPPVETVRKILPKGCVIGVSTHSLEEAKKCAAAGADYVSFSPIYSPLSKSGMVKPESIQGIGALEKVSKELSIPVIALGGITEENFQPCLNAGAASVAMITSIMASSDPRGAAERFSKLIT